jgi:lathosterol oxidase
MFNNIIFLILSYDIWFYISHIILHNIYFYKNIHRIHHSIKYENINYKDTYTGHFIEGPFQGIGFLFPLFFIDLNLYAIFISLLLINTRGMLRHDKRFIWLIGNHHLLHHKYSRYNFGEYWLDKLFRTNYPNIDEYEYGLIYM